MLTPVEKIVEGVEEVMVVMVILLVRIWCWGWPFVAVIIMVVMLFVIIIFIVVVIVFGCGGGCCCGRLACSFSGGSVGADIKIKTLGSYGPDKKREH
jgi:hypothetical protein